MRARVHLLRPLVLIALGLVTVACGGRSAPSHFYVLAPTGAAPAPAVDGRPVTIGVGPVRLPAYLDRPQIVTRRATEEIDLAEFDRWGEALADGVPRTIASNLSALLPNERIALFPWPGSRAVQYQVLVDVARFDGPLAGPVTLEGRWRIIGPERKDLVERRFAMSEAVGEPMFPAQVAALSRALGALSREIASVLTSL